MALLFEHLDNAFARFQESHRLLQTLDDDNDLYSIVRDSLVKRFEFTWDAFVKAVERCLKEDLANAGAVEEMTYKQHMVEAAKKGYISSVEVWLIFRKLRNKTSHTYFEVYAEQVAEYAQAFLDELLVYMPRLKQGHEDVTLNE